MTSDGVRPSPSTVPTAPARPRRSRAAESRSDSFSGETSDPPQARRSPREGDERHEWQRRVGSGVDVRVDGTDGLPPSTTRTGPSPPSSHRRRPPASAAHLRKTASG